MILLDSEIKEERSIGGGCIANAKMVVLNDGREFFVKSGTSPESFRLEANGLKELAKANAIRVPEVIHYDDEKLILEFIKTGNKGRDFYAIFGQQLAKLHRYTSASFGFYEDNFIGSSAQINKVEDNAARHWTSFYMSYRLMYQFNYAVAKGYADPAFRKLYAKIESNIQQILGNPTEPPTLLHGDLWSGNYMVDNVGNPVLIDPAVYYGHREADLAMTRLFGGFPDEFYKAYMAEFPLADGWEYRENIYKLYHILNHLNMFGSGYYAEAIQLMKYYVA